MLLRVKKGVSAICIATLLSICMTGCGSGVRESQEKQETTPSAVGKGETELLQSGAEGKQGGEESMQSVTAVETPSVPAQKADETASDSAKKVSGKKSEEEKAKGKKKTQKKEKTKKTDEKKKAEKQETVKEQTKKEKKKKAIKSKPSSQKEENKKQENNSTTENTQTNTPLKLKSGKYEIDMSWSPMAGMLVPIMEIDKNTMTFSLYNKSEQSVNKGSGTLSYRAGVYTMNYSDREEKTTFTFDSGVIHFTSTVYYGSATINRMDDSGAFVSFSAKK